MIHFKMWYTGISIEGIVLCFISQIKENHDSYELPERFAGRHKSRWNFSLS